MFLGDPLRMTIGAADKVNVVWAVFLGICRVHCGNVQPAVRHGGMALDATMPGVVVMTLVADKTAETLMYPSRGPVIRRSRLVKRIRCMALHTDALQGVVGHVDIPVSLADSDVRER